MNDELRDRVHGACMATLDRFMDALNAYDAAGMDREMHFPHVRLADGRVTVYERAGGNPMDLFERLRASDGWSYSRWGCRELIQFNERKAHYRVDYTRFRADHSVIGVYESLYVLTLEGDRWGVTARSSFGP